MTQDTCLVPPSKLVVETEQEADSWLPATAPQTPQTVTASERVGATCWALSSFLPLSGLPAPGLPVPKGSPLIRGKRGCLLQGWTVLTE